MKACRQPSACWFALRAASIRASSAARSRANSPSGKAGGWKGASTCSICQARGAMESACVMSGASPKCAARVAVASIAVERGEECAITGAIQRLPIEAGVHRSARQPAPQPAALREPPSNAKSALARGPGSARRHAPQRRAPETSRPQQAPRGDFGRGVGFLPLALQ
jgi:hypothetical protein